MAVYLSSVLTKRLPVSVIVQVASSASDEYRWEYPEEETSILHYGHEVEKQFSGGAFKVEEISSKTGKLLTALVFILHNGAMDKVQKIKIGVLLALTVVSLVLLVLWLADVIGFGLVVIFIIVQTAASVGVRVWAENAGRKPE